MSISICTYSLSSFVITNIFRCCSRPLRIWLSFEWFKDAATECMCPELQEDQQKSSSCHFYASNLFSVWAYQTPTSSSPALSNLQTFHHKTFFLPFWKNVHCIHVLYDLLVAYNWPLKNKITLDSPFLTSHRTWVTSCDKNL